MDREQGMAARQLNQKTLNDNPYITIKDYCAIAEHVLIQTGNHARYVEMWLTDVNETNKLEGYDHLVLICEDVGKAVMLQYCQGLLYCRARSHCRGWFSC